MRILEVFLPIFLLAGLGYLFARFKKFDIASLTDLVIYLTGPCLIFTSLARREFILSDFSFILGGAVFVILSLGIIVYLVLKLRNLSHLTDFYMPALFMNSAFIGFPVALFAYGQEGLSKMIIYDLTNTFLLLSLGIWILTRQQRSWEVFRLPYLYAAALAIAFSAQQVTVPEIIYQPIKILGETTIPLMLFALGYRLNTLTIKHLGLALMVSFFRIGLGFLLGFAFVLSLRIPSLTGKIIILGSSLPSAVSAFIFSEKYGIESELAASAVMVSTLISILTLPLILWFLS